MDKQRFVRKLVAAAVLAAFGASGMALAADEMEPNHPISSAQQLTITADEFGKRGAVVTGSITHMGTTPDVDFYSFYAQADDVITIDIDGTTGGLVGGEFFGFDAYLTLFGPMYSSTFPLEDDQPPFGTPLDDGSVNIFDPLIANLHITQSGTYTVAVTAFGTWLSPTGTYENLLPESSGAYTLKLSGVSLPGGTLPPDPAPQPEPEVMYIDINVKPGTVTRSRIDGKAKGVIPVALMSSPTFNATTVDVKTVTFGKTGTEGSLRNCAKGRHDFNKDGRPDLLCHFENHLSGFAAGDLQAFVKGKTVDGVAFEGRGSLKAVPEKPKR